MALPRFKTRASTTGGVRLIPDWGTNGELTCHTAKKKRWGTPSRRSRARGERKGLLLAIGSLGYLLDAHPPPEGVSCRQVPGIWGGVTADPKERRCRE